MVASIERHLADHAQVDELRQVVNAAGQTDWRTFVAPWHLSSHTLAALHGGRIVGFLRFVVQEIGPELDRPAVRLNGEALLEAKVLAFGVIEEAQGAGVGRQLQRAAIDWAEELQCYQMRSHSGGANVANHALKLKMGFGVHPLVRGDDAEGVYFILPLGDRSGH